MIIQATKAHTRALKVILEGGTQENHNSFYWAISSSRFQKTSLFTTADTALNLHYPISYSAAQFVATTVTSHIAIALQTELL